MYFNCWTLCQKSNFTNKKKNLCLRIRLTGKDVPRKLITKTINVQQAPGRAAGVVFSRARPVVFQQQKLYNVDGSSGGSLIKLKVQYNLGRVTLSCNDVIVIKKVVEKVALLTALHAGCF